MYNIITKQCTYIAYVDYVTPAHYADVSSYFSRHSYLMA